MFPLNLTCNLCGREVFYREIFCDECMSSLHFIGDEKCLTCGRATVDSVEVCSSCDGWAVDLARSVFTYDDGAAKLVQKLKYSGAKYLADIIAGYMAKVYVKNSFAPDIMTFVPMTDKELYERGFNHSEALAKSLAKKFDIRVIDLLIKKEDTKNQVGLTTEERRKNLKGSFVLSDPKAVEGKKILLVDDVLTTGATSGEIASVLKANKAASVYLLTVASVVRNGTIGK